MPTEPAGAPTPDDAEELLREALPEEVGSVAIVDLAALGRNAARVRRAIGPERFFWAVVKADGYGLGAIPVARRLLGAGADGLAVARLSEADSLRSAGIAAPILIMGPPPDDPPDDPNLVLTATCSADLRRLVAQRVSCPVHVKVDTGMGRLGLDADASSWLDAAARLGARWTGLWSHYSHGDVPGHPSIARQQELLRRIRSTLAAEGIRPAQIHMANSGGLRSLMAEETGVRVGLYLYGVNPWEDLHGQSLEDDDPVPRPEPVVEWMTRVHSLREVAAGHGLSYRSLHRTETETRVGVVPVGYADGLCALHRGRLSVWVAGGRRPIRGRVTMDLSVVELGAADVGEGAPAWLLGPRGVSGAVTVRDLAAACDRIAYEVLTGLGPRVGRWYAD